MWPINTSQALQYEREVLLEALFSPEKRPAKADANFMKALDEVRDQIASFPSEIQELKTQEFLNNALEVTELSDEVRSKLSSLQNRLRVFCLSENESSQLMWSHYADQHRGVAFGFDAIALENDFQRPLGQVEYVDSFPVLVDYKEHKNCIVYGLPSPGVNQELVNRWPLTKHRDWAYEKEWRFVTIASRKETGTHEDIEFLESSLVEICIGCRVDSTSAEKVIGLTKLINPDASVFRMGLGASDYVFEKNPIGNIRL